MEDNIFTVLKSGQYDKLLKIVSANPELLSTNNDLGFTIFHEACEVAPLEVVEQLVQLGGSIALKDQNGETPLWWAFNSLRFDTADFLISQGATLDVQNAEGFFPIHEASLYGEQPIVEYLLSKGVLVDQRSRGGQTALHFAAVGGGRELIRYLVAQGAEVNAQDNRGYSPLHFAIMVNDVKVWMKLERAEQLIKEGADIYAEADDGATPWTEASKYHIDDYTKLLSKYGKKS